MLEDGKYKIIDPKEREGKYANYAHATTKDIPWREPITEAEIKFARSAKNHYLYGALLAVAVALLMFLLALFNRGIKNWISILIVLGLFVLFTCYFLIKAIRIPLQICEANVIATKTVEHSSGKTNSYLYYVSVYFDYPTKIQVSNIAISKDLLGKLYEGQKIYIANGTTPRAAVNLDAKKLEI